MNKNILLILFMLGSVGQGVAQSFSALEDGKGNNVYDTRALHVFLRYTNVSGRHTATVSGLTANVSLRYDKYGKGETSWHFENPTLGDFIHVLFKLDKISSDNEQSFSSGFLGWHQIYFNVVAKDKLILSPGISLGDIIFGSERLTSSPSVLEPNGYYLNLGPAFKASYLINQDMWVDGFFRYDIGFKVGKPSGDYQNIDDYEKPHFVTVGANLHHKSRLFGGVRLMKMIDRGANNDSASRLDISAGYMFRL